jgi:hypothetical protein
MQYINPNKSALSVNTWSACNQRLLTDVLDKFSQSWLVRRPLGHFRYLLTAFRDCNTWHNSYHLISTVKNWAHQALPSSADADSSRNYVRFQATSQGNLPCSTRVHYIGPRNEGQFLLRPELQQRVRYIHYTRIEQRVPNLWLGWDWKHEYR